MARGSSWDNEHPGVTDTPAELSSDDDDIAVYERDGLEIHERPKERVHVKVPNFPACVTDARELRDALNDYLDGDEKHESAAFPETDADTSLTVAVDADVSDAADAIEALQTDVDALTEELNEAAERVEGINIYRDGLDFDLPAPSPSDVQAEMSESDTDSREMVPAEPLYELAEMWAGVSVHAPRGDEDARTYRQARQESGEWLKEELDALTDGENTEETSATNTSSETMGETDE